MTSETVIEEMAERGLARVAGAAEGGVKVGDKLHGFHIIGTTTVLNEEVLVGARSNNGGQFGIFYREHLVGIERTMAGAIYQAKRGVAKTRVEVAVPFILEGRKGVARRVSGGDTLVTWSNGEKGRVPRSPMPTVFPDTPDGVALELQYREEELKVRDAQERLRLLRSKGAIHLPSAVERAIEEASRLVVEEAEQLDP